MVIGPESLYRQLGQLVADIPGDLYSTNPISPDTHRWLGRAAALIEAANDGAINADHLSFGMASEGLNSSSRSRNAHEIVVILHRALARAELKAPASAQGAFIPVGAAFDALQAVGKVLREATSDVLIVDPYMNGTVLTDFSAMAPEGVTLRLLSDSHSNQADTLRPPVARWKQQYGNSRPLEARLTASRLLHDRIVVVDGARVWSLTQSLKDFAGRSPASVVRVDAEVAKLKTGAYAQLWAIVSRCEPSSASRDQNQPHVQKMPLRSLPRSIEPSDATQPSAPDKPADRRAVEWNKRDWRRRITRKVLTVALCLIAPCPLALDANLAQINAGMAWHYKEYEREQSPADRAAYADAEADARARRVGLWVDSEPIPPWEFRRQKPSRSGAQAHAKDYSYYALESNWLPAKSASERRPPPHNQ